MINSILEAICVSLETEFGGAYQIHREEKKQELTEPCFWVLCLTPASRLFLNKRYFRKNPFCIHYFPGGSGKREECHAVAERLFSCLEWLDVGGDPVMGTKMEYEIVDGILHFFVNYDLFVCRVSEPIPLLEEVSSKTQLKHGEGMPLCPENTRKYEERTGERTVGKSKTQGAPDTGESGLLFSKEQLVSSERFRERKDILEALLDESETYTIKTAEEKMENYMKGKVK